MRRDKREAANKKGKIIVLIVVIILMALLVWFKAPDYYVKEVKGKTNLVINNNNVTSKMKDDVYIDKYGTGLVPILSGANAPKDKSGKLVEFEFGTNNLKIKPNKTTLNGYNGKTVAYYDIYVTFEAKFNESKVFVLKNNNTYVPTGYNIKGHVFIDAPETKNGKKTTPRNNVIEHTEK